MKSLKKVIESAPVGVPVQVIRTTEGYEWRVGTYADKAISLVWTMKGWSLPFIDGRKMTIKEAKEYLS